MRRLRWAALLWLAFLAGCSLTPAVTLGPASTQLPAQSEITTAPFFPQALFQCGPAALATVLGHYGHPRTPDQLKPQLFTPDARGTFPAEIDALARREGFVSYPIRTLDELLVEVAAGHPVLVLQNLGTDWLSQWHFAVVVGYDLDRRELVLRSGTERRRITALDLFDLTWQRGERWGRVILPPQTLPATAEPLRHLAAVADLEQTGPLPAAAQGYQSALRQWPDHPLALFGLANVTLQQKQPEQSAGLLARLLAQRPDWAAAWNNYAYALQASGCAAAARAAIQCALRLAPDDPALQASRGELLATGLPAGQFCPLPASSLIACPR